MHIKSLTLMEVRTPFCYTEKTRERGSWRVTKVFGKDAIFDKDDLPHLPVQVTGTDKSLRTSLLNQ